MVMAFMLASFLLSIVSGYVNDYRGIQQRPNCRLGMMQDAPLGQHSLMLITTCVVPAEKELLLNLVLHLQLRHSLSFHCDLSLYLGLPTFLVCFGLRNYGPKHPVTKQQKGAGRRKSSGGTDQGKGRGRGGGKGKGKGKNKAKATEVEEPVAEGEAEKKQKTDADIDGEPLLDDGMEDEP